MKKCILRSVRGTSIVGFSPQRHTARATNIRHCRRYLLINKYRSFHGWTRTINSNPRDGYHVTPLSFFSYRPTVINQTNIIGGFSQKRSMFVKTGSTPNPDSLKFYPENQVILPNGTIDFPDAKSAVNSPLARYLFKQQGVKRVFFAHDFITITKDDDVEWEQMKPIIIGTLFEFYSTGHPVMLEESDAPEDTKVMDEDSEAVAMIKELLETRIRPAVQDDGGDITYLGFIEGVVFLQMQGSCSGCPSSAVTLKGGIERMLMHWIPEVVGVMGVDSVEEFEKITQCDSPAKAMEELSESQKLQQLSQREFEKVDFNLSSQSREGETDETRLTDVNDDGAELNKDDVSQTGGKLSSIYPKKLAKKKKKKKKKDEKETVVK